MGEKEDEVLDSSGRNLIHYDRVDSVQIGTTRLLGHGFYSKTFDSVRVKFCLVA